MRKIIFIFSFLIFQFSFASLEITEIMYNPEGNDNSREWIEVKNNSSQQIRITSGRGGWRINDGSNHLFEEELTVNPGELFVILQDRNLFLKDYPNFFGKSILANFNLKNESAQIQIFDENKNLLVSIFYHNSCGGNGNGYSIVLVDGQCKENKIKGGTPGNLSYQIYEEENRQKEENLTSTGATTSSQVTQIIASTEKQDNFQKISISTPTPTSTLTPSQPLGIENENQAAQAQKIKTTLIISEFYPNPEGNDEGKEFVEIYNYGETAINLETFILKIGEKKIKLKGTIEPNEYWLLNNRDYNFYIRNKGESLALYYNQEKIFEISYQGKAPEGKSYSRDEKGRWLFTKPTPGEENIFLEEKNFLKEGENYESLITNLEKKEDFQQTDFLKAQVESSFVERNNNYLYIILALAFIFLLVLLVWFKL
jgi:hypothetical protein